MEIDDKVQGRLAAEPGTVAYELSVCSDQDHAKELMHISMD